MIPLEFDVRHLWHPYTNINDPGPMHLVRLRPNMIGSTIGGFT